MRQDWQSLLLGDVLTLQRGYDLPTSQRDVNGTIPVISSSGATGFHNEVRAKAPGVVTGRYGTTGKLFFIEEDFWPLNTTLYVRDFKGNDERFVYYLLQTIDFEKYSGKTGVPGVNRNDLHAIPVLIPPLPEQRTIAAILSTWDDAIALTARLIDALKRRKQALMQRLLTGQTRFPEFEGEAWEEKTVEELARIEYGKSPKDIVEEDGLYPIYGTSGIVGRTNKSTSPSAAIILGRKGTINAPQLSETPSWAIDTTYFCTPLNGVDLHWLYHLFWSMELEQYNEASGVPSLSRNTVYALPVQVPRLPEQLKIANTLDTADVQISKVQQYQEALQTQKRGLMQCLLTGQVRVQLKENEE